jgi:hypothetical protein
MILFILSIDVHFLLRTFTLSFGALSDVNSEVWLNHPELFLVKPVSISEIDKRILFDGTPSCFRTISTLSQAIQYQRRHGCGPLPDYKGLAYQRYRLIDTSPRSGMQGG